MIEAILNNKTVRAQVDINVKDSEGWTPLAAACYWQQPGAVEVLMSHGADVDMKTGNGQTLEELTDHELIHSQLESILDTIVSLRAQDWSCLHVLPKVKLNP